MYVCKLSLISTTICMQVCAMDTATNARWTATSGMHQLVPLLCVYILHMHGLSMQPHVCVCVRVGFTFNTKSTTAKLISYTHTRTCTHTHTHTHTHTQHIAMVFVVFRIHSLQQAGLPPAQATVRSRSTGHYHQQSKTHSNKIRTSSVPATGLY